MKRLIVLLLSLLMALNLCACNILPVSAPTPDPTETTVVTVPETTTTEASYPWLNAESTQKLLDCGWSLENIDILMGVIPDMDTLYKVTKISDFDYELVMDNGIEYYATFRDNTLIQVYTKYENPTQNDFLYNVG